MFDKRLLELDYVATISLLIFFFFFFIKKRTILSAAEVSRATTYLLWEENFSY